MKFSSFQAHRAGVFFRVGRPWAKYIRDTKGVVEGGTRASSIGLSGLNNSLVILYRALRARLPQVVGPFGPGVEGNWRGRQNGGLQRPGGRCYGGRL